MSKADGIFIENAHGVVLKNVEQCVHCDECIHCDVLRFDQAYFRNFFIVCVARFVLPCRFSVRRFPQSCDILQALCEELVDEDQVDIGLANPHSLARAATLKNWMYVLLQVLFDLGCTMCCTYNKNQQAI